MNSTNKNVSAKTGTNIISFNKIRQEGGTDLLDEEAFAKLIASDKHFGRTVPAEQV